MRIRTTPKKSEAFKAQYLINPPRFSVDGGSSVPLPQDGGQVDLPYSFTVTAADVGAVLGDVLIAGTNVTITDNGDGTFTIDSSGGGGGGGSGSNYFSIRLVCSTTAGSDLSFGVNNTSYVLFGNFFFNIDLATFLPTDFRIMLLGQSSEAAQTVTLQLVASTGATNVLHTGGDDVVVTNSSGLFDSGWRSFDNPSALTGIQQLGIAANGSNGSVDLIFRYIEIHFKKAAAAAPYRGALVTKAADQTGANYTVNPTFVAWDAESYDTDSIHDNVTNNSRLTVPAGVTKVRLSGQVSLNNVTTSQYIFIGAAKNGVTTAYTGQAFQAISFSAAFPIISFTGPVISVVAGDYFQMSLLVQSDTSIDVIKDQSWFAMEIIE